LTQNTVKILKQKNSWFSGLTHNYFVARKFFKGDLQREIHVTVYDPVLDMSSYGDLFVCQKNVLLSINTGLTYEAGIYEFEMNDIFSQVTSDDELLTKVLNKTGEATTLTSKTVNEKPLIWVNKQFLILPGLQAELKNGTLLQGSFKTIYLNRKDDAQRIENLFNIIQKVIRGESFSTGTMLPGLSSSQFLVSIYFVLIFAPVFTIAFVLFFFFILIYSK